MTPEMLAELMLHSEKWSTRSSRYASELTGAHLVETKWSGITRHRRLTPLGLRVQQAALAAARKAMING